MAAVETTTTSRSELDGPEAQGARYQQVLVCVLASFLAFFLVHCSRCDAESAPAPSASTLAPQPPARPRGLVAEFVIPRPDTLWSATRELASAFAPVLPSEGALALVHGLALPLSAAGLFDLKLPILGVLTADAGGRVVPTLALPVTSGRELVALLTTGAAPLFVAEASASGVTRLNEKAPNPRYRMAVFRNHLIVSSASDKGLDSAPFLVQVAAARPLPDAALALTARQPELAGPLLELLRSKWRAYQAELRESEAQARRQRGGRPPDFADPEAVLTLLNSGVEAVLTLLATSKELTLACRFGADDATLSLELLPQATGRAKQLVQGQVMGSTEPLRSLSADTAIGVLSRSSPAERIQRAGDVGTGIERVFGTRLDERERADVSAIFGNFARGRGDHTTASLLLGQTPALVVQGALGGQAELETALRNLPRLLEIRPMAAPLAHFVGPVKSAPVRTLLKGQAVSGHTVSFGSKGPLHQHVPAGLSVFWSTTDSTYRVVVGGAQALSHLEPSASKSLDAWPQARALFDRIESASFVLLVRPVLLGWMPEDPRSAGEPLISISAGRRGDTGFLNTYIPGEVIRYYARPNQP